MKVLHVITGLNVGGAENMLAKLVEAGGDGAEKPEVLSLLSPGPIAERITSQGVKVHSLNMRRGLAGPKAIRELRRLVAEVAPDLLHGWMYHGNLAAGFARTAQRRTTPLIWNIRHSIPDLSKETKRTRLLLKLSARISRGSDAIVYNAQVSRRQHENIGYAAAHGLVIPNGFDVAKFSVEPHARDRAGKLFGFAEGALRVACIARLHPMKDQARLVKAVAIARASGSDIHLLLVGDGLAEPPPELAQLISDNIPPDRITTCGARFDVAEWLPGLDIVAVSSAWGEAFPNVIGEAMACGVPVVTTDVGDSAAIVGDAGLVVPPADTEAMAQALTVLAARSVEARQALGRTGREKIVDEYSISKIAVRYDQLYRACYDRQAQNERDGVGPIERQHSAR